MPRGNQPWWWPAFVAVERAVGSRLESATRSEEFAELATRLSRAYARGRQLYLRSTADALHRANLPAHSDLLALTEQVTAVQRRLDDLALELERRAGEERVRPPSNPRRRRSSDR
jgi:hypothetical protein